MSEMIEWLERNRRTLRVHRKQRSAIVTRTYPYTLAELWHACTDRARLARWFGNVEGPFTIGAELKVDAGMPRLITCRLLACDEQQRLLITWSYDGDPLDPPDEVEVRFALEHNGATLEIEHRSAVLYPCANSVGAGWESWIWGLEGVLAGKVVEQRGAPDSWNEAIDGRWKLHEPAAELIDHGQRKTLRFQRKLYHPVDKVWSALLSNVDRWYPGKIDGDLTTGSALRFTYEDGTQLTGSVVALDAPHLLVLREENDEVKVQLESQPAPRPDSTLLTFEHSFDGPGRPALHAVGWDACLDALNHVLGAAPSAPLTPEQRSERTADYAAYFAERNA